ncbi:YbaB/EbfC family nucleoid-associated protein [Streptomyces polygonati]|uniref:YbaB/EbfC family nucleoid-associated protein n=1 Tax=Streptomyces polygonati TaxID=1617087 RepID=A0ABV8HRQ3_9ACTN
MDREAVSARLAQAMAELEATEAAAAAAEEELRAATYTVRSRDRSVEVTLGPQGELAGLRFLDERHRTMSAAQLASAVLEAAAEARERMARRVMRVLDPLTRASPSVPELPGFSVDWTRIFGPGVLDEDGPDAADGGPPARRPGGRRLRDEIHED